MASYRLDMFALICAVIAISAACSSGNQTREAFCADWENVIEQTLAADTLLVEGPPYSADHLAALEQLQMAGEDLLATEAPDDVAEAMATWSDIVRSGAGGIGIFSPQHEEWERSSVEIRTYLSDECTIDPDSLERFYDSNTQGGN